MYFDKMSACVDELPAVDLLSSRSLSGSFAIQPVSDISSGDIDMYKVVSLPVIIERYVTAPIRAQSVSFVYCLLYIRLLCMFVNKICLHLLI